MIVVYVVPLSGEKMAEAEWCKECGRMIGIGCNCGMTFKDKIKGVAFSFDGWAPTNQSIAAPDSYKEKYPQSKLSKDRPPPLR